MVPLSVIVASQNARHTVLLCLESIVEQGRGRAEIFLVDNSSDGTAELARTRFPGVRVVNQPPGDLIPDLWQVGIQQSSGAVVVLTTAHFVPASDWLDAILEAHQGPVVAVGGAIEPDPQSSVVDLAVYFCRYSRYLPPFEPQAVDDLAADNASYKRAALAVVADTWTDGFWEPPVHAALLRSGGELLLSPAVRVRHVRSFQFLGFIRQRFLHGRRYGSDRCRTLDAPRRVMLAALSPLIPALYLVRIARHTRRRPSALGLATRALPVLTLFLLAWASGEFLGYLRGSSPPLTDCP